MKVIYKYPLIVTDEQTVGVPLDAEFLSVQFQGTQLCLWAAVDTEHPPCTHAVRIVGTGNPMSDMNLFKFLGTVQTPPFVWHVYVCKYPK